MKKLFLLPVFVFLILLASCKGEEKEIFHIPSNSCNVFSMGDCLTPFPSNQFLKYNGMKRYISLPQNSLQPTYGGAPFPVNEFKIFDGFSPAGQIMVLLNGAINVGSHFPDIFHPEISTKSFSSIQLFDTKTWKRIPLFAEGDSRSYKNNFLLIHPLIRLYPDRTYLVVLTKEISYDAVQPTAFKALVDGVKTDNSYVESIRRKFNGYFRKLSLKGIPSNKLFLVWDFTTESDKNIIGNNLGKILNFLKDYPNPSSSDIIYSTIVTYPDRNNGNFLLKQVKGKIPVPWLMNSDGTRINRDADGSVDTEDYDIKYIPFVENIPRCVTNSTPHIMVYGHGLGGSAEDLNGYTIRKDAQQWCAIELAVNWYGADYEGLESVIQRAIISDEHPFYGFITMAERLLQGHLDFLMLIKSIPAITGITIPGLSKVGSEYNNFKDSPLFYYGVSNGGIQGGTLAYTAYNLTPFFYKFALNVNGAVWSILFQRYNNWNYFESVFMLKVPSIFEITKMVVLAQFFYDFVDPITFARYYSLSSSDSSERLPLHILSQESIGDASVSNITTEIWARTAGIPGLAKLIDNPYGIVEKSGPLSSALTQWDGHPKPLPPFTNSPLGKHQTTVVKCGSSYTVAHGVPFCLDTAREQVKRFINTGLIFQLCSNDICDPN